MWCINFVNTVSPQVCEDHQSIGLESIWLHTGDPWHVWGVASLGSHPPWHVPWWWVTVTTTTLCKHKISSSILYLARNTIIIVRETIVWIAATQPSIVLWCKTACVCWVCYFFIVWNRLYGEVCCCLFFFWQHCIHSSVYKLHVSNLEWKHLVFFWCYLS